MDAFFASVEQHDHPELLGKPIAVGGDTDRSVVSTASYEARRWGVHSAMSMQVAKRRCPELIVVPGRHERYREVSQQVHQVFQEYTPIIEPLSIDEAFLDVTDNNQGIALAVDIAKEIKQRIHEVTGLTASAGVSYNKFLAKIASDYRKPDGLCTIHPEKAQAFIDQLSIEDFWGVGPKTAQQMHYMGIFTGEQLRACSLHHLEETFGKQGRLFYDFARGIDERPVVVSHLRKSVGCEHTFEEDISLPSTVLIELYHTVLELEQRIAKAQFAGHTLTLKIKYADFIQITRSTTSRRCFITKADLLPEAKKLLRLVSYDTRHPIRLMGLSVSNPEGEGIRAEWVEQWLDFRDD